MAHLLPLAERQTDGISFDYDHLETHKKRRKRSFAVIAGTVGAVAKSKISPVKFGLNSLSDAEWHEVAKTGEWCALQVSNLRPLPCEGNALPLS